MVERLQKIMSSLGITSRRKAEALISEGRITVNGKVAVPGTKVDFEQDYIKIDGKLINTKQRVSRIYLKFYKPHEVVTTLSDPEERPTIREFIKEIKYRIYPVGRLDYHSEGLLLLTNDGEFTHSVLHPSKKISKTYHVKVKGVIEDNQIKELREGVRLEDGFTAPAQVKRLRGKKTQENSWIEMVIYEGKKRQIRRMLLRVGHPVIRLKRVAIDGILLGDLNPGEWEHLTERELKTVLNKRLRVNILRRSNVQR